MYASDMRSTSHSRWPPTPLRRRLHGATRSGMALSSIAKNGGAKPTRSSRQPADLTRVRIARCNYTCGESNRSHCISRCRRKNSAAYFEESRVSRGDSGVDRGTAAHAGCRPAVGRADCPLDGAIAQRSTGGDRTRNIDDAGDGASLQAMQLFHHARVVRDLR